MRTDYPGFDFQVLQDTTPDLHVYRNVFGLGYSRLANWSPSVIYWYAKQYFEGRSLEYPDGDPNQLGGDFLFDEEGNCQLEYRSSGPLDRVSLDQVLKILSANKMEQVEEQSRSTEKQEECST